MTQSFDMAFAFTHKEEGGFILSTLAGDSGGETYAGIARNKQPQWEGWVRIDQGDTISTTLQNMVKNFYFNRFWLRMNLEQLPQPLATLAYDWGVNSGNIIAIKKLQYLLNVNDDGILGSTTAGAARSMPPDKLAMRYLAARLDFLNDLNAWMTFGKGWTQRVVDLLNFASQ